jgi:hypothetical protein
LKSLDSKKLMKANESAFVFIGFRLFFAPQALLSGRPRIVYKRHMDLTRLPDTRGNPIQRPNRGNSPMPEPSPNLADIDERISILKENLRQLIEQSASYSGAADEDLVSRRIAEQEAELELLTKRRDELSRPPT